MVNACNLLLLALISLLRWCWKWHLKLPPGFLQDGQPFLNPLPVASICSLHFKSCTFLDRACTFFESSVMSCSFSYLAIVAQFVPHPIPDCYTFRGLCLEPRVSLIHIQPKLRYSLCNNLFVFYFKTSLILLLLWVLALLSPFLHSSTPSCSLPQLLSHPVL